MAIQDIKNPRWVNNGTAILVDVLADGDTEYGPFVAMPDDVTEHGRQLFSMAQAGEFGEVAAESA